MNQTAESLWYEFLNSFMVQTICNLVLKQVAHTLFNTILTFWPVLVKNMDIFASYANKWIQGVFLENFDIAIFWAIKRDAYACLPQGAYSALQ